jgi:hypothetical protein
MKLQQHLKLFDAAAGVAEDAFQYLRTEDLCRMKRNGAALSGSVLVEHVAATLSRE